MFKSVIIMSGSGVVLFEKSWDKKSGQKETSFANQWGGLVRAVLEFSKQSVGLPLSHLAAGETAISIATDPKTAMICVLFHSGEDPVTGMEADLQRTCQSLVVASRQIL